MKKVLKVSTIILCALLIVSGTLLYLAVSGVFGRHEGPGTVTPVAVPDHVVTQRIGQRQTSAPNSTEKNRQVLFGDLHVHTTVSSDAFLLSLPLVGGEGSRPQADACDFARYCSALDFWSINDHAEELTLQRWQETVDAVRQCNAVAGDETNPDMVSFLGWEWTQMGMTPDNHFGHKNVVLKSTEADEIPTRPIAARPPEGINGEHAQLSRVQLLGLTALGRDQRALDAALFYQETRTAKGKPCETGVPVRDLPDDCMESAATPRELFDKLDDWGVDSIVIPHGTSWGNYTPPLSSWRKQLSSDMHDPDRQIMVEVYSGHGSAEEYRDWRAVIQNDDGTYGCPEPTDVYLPACWQAGEIIRDRCLAEGLEGAVCDSRAVEARHEAAQRGSAGHLVVGGSSVEEWLDAGQCKDCFIPAFNHRPMGSTQYMAAIRNADSLDPVQRFRFGFAGSSDNHAARPGTGYKEVNRREMTEAAGLRVGARSIFPEKPRLSKADPVDVSMLNVAARAERDRITSFFSTGGLVALHSDGRSRDDIWNAMTARRSYATSGERILLWFSLMNGPGGAKVDMGGETKMSAPPSFQVKAVGAFEQKEGCPDFAEQTLGAERLYDLCRNECYNPSNVRKKIDRIEVVRIRPQTERQEPVGDLIEDPWLVHACDDQGDGCVFDFTDETFSRDTVYYVRAVQAPTMAINGRNLRCIYDQDGNCISLNPCHGDANLTDYEDDCLSEVEERAWSSPVYVDY